LARRISQLKSGRYTIERPLHLGAALAAPDQLSRVAAPLTAYGRPLGEAFQLKDDLLGVFGDADFTGKPVGDDLREGKPTLLYALTRVRATGLDAKFLSARYGSVDLSDHEVEELRQLFESTGARQDVESTIERLIDDALTAVGSLPLAEEARQGLAELAGFVGGRDR
jgi:geranylgeranyl diphosphate synthase type I